MSDEKTAPSGQPKREIAGTQVSPSGGAAPDPNQPEPLLPPVVGRYAAHTFHQPGGMGRVWRATDAELGREVALKEIRPKFAHEKTARERFEFEAEVTGRLEHPAIIPVYGFGRDAAGLPYYAMRFVEGQTLSERLAAFHAREWPDAAARALELRRLLGSFVTVCRAISYAHSRGVIHRDLKPSNVILGAFGEAFVLDWGIAKRLNATQGEAAEAPLDGNEEPDLTKSRRSATTNQIGSPQFWSPEQATPSLEQHTERTDVYGLGAILYAILTGSSPHPLGVHSLEPRSARAVRNWVDAGLDAITAKALALNPADRYDSAEAVALAVEEWLAEQPVAAQRIAVAELEVAFAAHPEDYGLEEQLARQRSNLALLLAGMGRTIDALAIFRMAEATFGDLANRRNKARLFAEQAGVMVSRARCHDQLSQQQEARDARIQAAKLYGRLISTRPDEYRHAAVYMTLAGVVPTAAPPEPLDQTIAHPAVVRSKVDEHSESQVGPPDPQATIPAEPPHRLPDELKVLGHGFEIQDELGRGAIGSVFRARDTLLNREVAIKTVNLRDGAGHAAFLHEARLTAQLHHPHIVTVHLIGTRSDNTPFIVMELLRGKTLRDSVRENERATEATPLLRTVADIASAVAYAHTRGVIHRDVKPSNIFITETGRPVLLDWGLAKITNGPEVSANLTSTPIVTDRPTSETQVGQVMGTPAYMSPEQARGESVGLAADVFALGACLYEVITGRALSSGTTVLEILQQRVFGAYPRLRESLPTAPLELDRICTHAMSFKPEDRPTASEFERALRNYITTTEAARLQPPTPERRWWQFWKS